jgi:LDH2 family malate/lactate/ureidoglycolate dehydrogenase
MSLSANAATTSVRVDADKLIGVVADIFAALGVVAASARIVAEDLVLADLEGVGSHGVMLLPMYVERLQKGSVSKESAGAIVVDNRTSIVIDAHHALGQLTAHQAVGLVTSRAREYGMATVAVRNAFHFGTAGRYARLIASQGCVGIVMSNTRPLLPAPGGAEAITGNNPIAFAVPSNGTHPVEVDMALSATAMGKIRLAAAAGKPIPADWAMAADGSPTTDPNEAIKGMLAPAAGPKGFGLAFVIDLLCGGLSDGAIGAEVRPLYGDASQPYRCSQLFLALDVRNFTDPEAFAERVKEQAQRVSRSKHAPGIERVYAPGELAYATREGNAGKVTLSRQTFDGFVTAAKSAGVQVEPLL